MNTLLFQSVNKRKLALMAAICSLITANTASALSVTQTMLSSNLAAALGGGGGLTITSATVINGAPEQFGTYTGFNSPPVTIGNGVVLSTGQVLQTTAAFHSNGDSPDTDTGAPGTAEFNAYGPGHIMNFIDSHNVAALQVTFTLAAPSQVGFNFIFGSVEYPDFTSAFTDAFVGFLDGTSAANQIIFDGSGNAVQVGTTFSNAVRTDDTNTAFSNPHGLLALQTFTQGALSAGTHTLTFEVGDVNDPFLDSAVFISGLHAGSGTGGTTVEAIPEPGTWLVGSFACIALFAASLAGRRS